MPVYTENLPHTGSGEQLFLGCYDEPAGTIARTIPRHLLTVNNLAAFTTGGQVAARIIPLAAGMVISNIAVCLGGTAAVGPSHFWLGLADAQLNVLAVTADQGAAAQNANAYTKLALTGPYLVTSTGLYVILASSSSATTAPTAAGVNINTALFAGIPPVLCGTAGNQAAPPAAGAQLNGGVITAASGGNFGAWLS